MFLESGTSGNATLSRWPCHFRDLSSARSSWPGFQESRLLPAPVTLSKVPCRVSLSNGRRGITRSHGFSLDLRFPSRNTTYRSSGSPFGTSQSQGLPLPELNIGYRSKYKLDYARAGDCMPLPCWLGDLFMDHKASASLPPTVVSLSLC